MANVTFMDAGGLVTMRLPKNVSADQFSVALSIDCVPGAPLNSDFGAELASFGFRNGAKWRNNGANSCAISQISPPLRGGLESGANATAPTLTLAQPSSPAPAGKGRSRTDPKLKVEYYRGEIKTLTALKVKLAPIHDAHKGTLDACRTALQASHANHPVLASPEVTKTRLKLHDQIVESSAARGNDFRRYKEVSSMIDMLSREIERLEVAK